MTILRGSGAGHEHANQANLDAIDQDLGAADRPTFNGVQVPTGQSFRSGGDGQLQLFYNGTHCYLQLLSGGDLVVWDATNSKVMGRFVPGAADAHFEAHFNGVKTVETTADGLNLAAGKKFTVAGVEIGGAGADEDRIAALETNLIAEAVRRVIGDADGGREFQGDGWVEVFEDGAGVEESMSSGWEYLGGYLRPIPAQSGASKPFDFADAADFIFENVQQGAVNFQVDTANTSGHFEDGSNVAVSLGSGEDCPRVLAGCRFKLSGDATIYTVASIAGDGSADDAVGFSGGDKPAGTYAVEWVRGGLIESGTLGLSGYESQAQVGDAVGDVIGNASSNAANAFDGTTDQAANACATRGGETMAVGKDFGASGKIITGFKVWGSSDSGFSYALGEGLTVRLLGSNTNDPDTATQLASTVVADASGLLVSDLAVSNSTAYRYYWVEVSGSSSGDVKYVAEIQFFELSQARPAGARYTAVSDAGGYDCSAWSDVNGCAVTETLDSGEACYSLSFDGRDSFRIWTGSAWRVIASSLASDHGGTDGVWRWRDGSDTWTDAYADNAPAAISQAVGADAANRMSGTTLAGISDADWEATGGWSSSVDDLDLGVTLYVSDAAYDPTVDEVELDVDVEAQNATIVFLAHAAADPDKTKVTLIADPQETITLNTDLQAWVRRGSEAWVQVTLSHVGQLDADHDIYEGEADLSGAGTSTRLKILTANGKSVYFRAAANNFRSDA